MNQKRPFYEQIKKLTLAEQVAEALKELILEANWLPGEALPTEPELAEQFGVSRAVVRDATRMLAAQGLVEAQHGRGVFVTESQVDAFAEALLLALRREGATVWDVEHFEQLLYPEIFALVAAEATDEEIAALEVGAAQYLKVVRGIHEEHWDSSQLPESDSRRLLSAYQALMLSIFGATHNKVLELLAVPLLRLRNVRYWQDAQETPEEIIEMEQTYFQIVLEAVKSGDPDFARQTVRRMMELPPEAEVAMRNTTIGKVPQIDISGRPSN